MSENPIPYTRSVQTGRTLDVPWPYFLILLRGPQALREADELYKIPQLVISGASLEESSPESQFMISLLQHVSPLHRNGTCIKSPLRDAVWGFF